MSPADLFSRPLPSATGTWSVDEGPDGTAFGLLTVTDPAERSRLRIDLGELVGVRRWTALHRYESYWMKVAFGTGPLPVETQFAFLDLGEGRIALLVPLVEEPTRVSIEGDLTLVLETGDGKTPVEACHAFFVAIGSGDPDELLDLAAESIAGLLGIPLREEKSLPSFADRFGWCTWDAFYKEVSHEKVREGLASWRASGIRPRFLILDDGWQPVLKARTGEERLTDFSANEKFPDGLYPTVSMAKGEFGIESFLVWHAMQGYWGGVDMTDYRPTYRKREPSPGILSHEPSFAEWFGGGANLVPPREVHRFFQDYHRSLAAEGVDGVKVDNQAGLELLAEGHGGRVTLMRAYREAIEGAAAVHFGGNLINCMSCSNEMLYGARASNLTRTSTDFWPDKPETHGEHLAVNAFVGAWFGRFVHPDWDMFQSGHPMGAFHAAGRAVSGGPVYCSDKPGTHDAELLKKLVLRDGGVYRARTPGRPLGASLFEDVLTGNHLLRVGAANEWTGVVGLFNCRHGDEAPTLTATLATGELMDGPCAMRLHRAGSVHHGAASVSVAPLEWEIVTVSPLEDGVAWFGLAEYLNGGAAIVDADGASCELDAPDGGTLVGWAQDRIVRAWVNNGEVGFEQTPDGAFRFAVPEGALIAEVEFAED